MTLNDYVRQGIDDLMTTAAIMAADASDDPDHVAGVPMAFSHVGEALWKAWLSETKQTEDEVM